MTTFYLVRHGESEGNRKDIILGQLESPLSETGIEQARTLSKKLGGIRFDAVYSSDLLRAKQTAEIVALEHALPIIASKLLRERSAGSFEGKKHSDAQEELRELLVEFEKKSNAEKMSHKFDAHMESGEETAMRLITFLREVSLARPGETILVVCHTALIGSFLVHLGHSDYAGMFGASGLGHASYITIKSDGIDFFVETPERNV